MKLRMIVMETKNFKWWYGRLMSTEKKLICMWQNSGRYSDKL